MKIRKLNIKCNDASKPNIFLCSENHRHVVFTFNDDELDFLNDVIAEYKESLMQAVKEQEQEQDKDPGKDKDKDKDKEKKEFLNVSIELADDILNRLNFSDDD